VEARGDVECRVDGGDGALHACTHTSKDRAKKGGRERERKGGKVATYLRGILRVHPHLSQMALGHGVALEPILIPALLLAHLAVPSQTLQALAFGFVGNGLGRAGRGFGHGSSVCDGAGGRGGRGRRGTSK